MTCVLRRLLRRLNCANRQSGKSSHSWEFAVDEVTNHENVARDGKNECNHHARPVRYFTRSEY